MRDDDTDADDDVDDSATMELGVANDDYDMKEGRAREGQARCREDLAGDITISSRLTLCTGVVSRDDGVKGEMQTSSESEYVAFALD